MTKQRPSITDSMHFQDSSPTSDIMEKIFNNKQIILGSIVSLLLILLIAYRFLSTENSHKEVDFIKAQNTFNAFQQEISTNGSASKESLEELTALMKRLPDLQAKYDGSIAQSLLISGQIAEAKPYIESIFQRTAAEHLSLYKDFTAISYASASKNYEQALDLSLKLNQALLNSPSLNENSVLYTLNLIRTAALYEQLGKNEEELATWNLVEKELKESDTGSILATALQTGKTSLKQFIDGRKKIIQ